MANKITIQDLACQRLIEGKADAEILAEVREVFPGAKTTKNCLDWYRNMLRKRGILQASAPRPKLSEAEAKERKRQRDAAWRAERAAKWEAERLARAEAAK